MSTAHTILDTSYIALLREQIEQVPPVDGVNRATLRLGPEPLLDWLIHAPGHYRIYGSTRDSASRVEMAGVGVADECVWEEPVQYQTALRTLRERLGQHAAGIRYFGGFRFVPGGRVDPEWRQFGSARFVVPRLQCVSDQRGLTVSIHFTETERHDGSLEPWLDLLLNMEFALPEWQDTFPPPDTRTDCPDYSGWELNVLAALAEFDRGHLEKVVLARKADYLFHGYLDPITLLHRLQNATPECYHFCYTPVPELAFVGASPERLYRREGDWIESEAVAGTRMRGKSLADDEALGHDLLNSQKDRREHDIVCESIRSALQPLCSLLETDDTPRLMKLARGQHLYTGVRGRLHPGVTDADLIKALHPTPALGGHPTKTALQRIAEWEPFDRGWYAAPIGWVTPEAAEFAVAIRSGLVQPKRLSLFSGAGIVKGSTPEMEWDEIELKIRDFIKVLTGP